jgi:hypothetical protein
MIAMHGAGVKTNDSNAQSAGLELRHSCRKNPNDNNAWRVSEDLEHPHEEARTMCFFLQFTLTAEGLHPTGRISLVKFWGEENRVQLPTAPSHGCGWKEWITPPTK